MNWRRVLGNILIAIPLVFLLSLIPLAVLMGSLGMDIHFTSRAKFYVVDVCLLVFFMACGAIGVRLRSTSTKN